MTDDVSQREVEQLIGRVEEGMTTVADAEFLREILGLNDEKVVPEREKGAFEQKSAR